MATRMKKLPGVLSFQRCMFPTDALFYNLYSGKDKTALPVIRHGIRGTQNINKTWSEKATEATVASAKRDEVSNIQTTDSAKLDVSANALSVQFDLRFIDLSDALFACAAGKGDSMDDIKTFRDNVAQFIDKAKNGKGIVEVACRYARNIANGRFLWRNRTIAESIQIRVDDSDEKSASGFSVTFNALDVPLNTFDNISEDEKKLADVIVKGLKGDRQARLRISARVDFGMQGPLEVFPSQNYLENKSRGFARSLYFVGGIPSKQEAHTIEYLGQAAIRDQKISNALRTIDTWYPGFENRNIPIPVEPNGASLDAQQFFRADNKSSGFRLMEKITDLDPDTEDGMFLLACIIRGGVYSGSDN
ncbi:type I-F CRISPR-associated protein Csy3 [Oxalobacter formigenes]|nr:type I-F CRISPR-associated protein Csy3 [Oxalobacter formigenes]ARQ46594.1 CRISPR-associated protein Csy3 [Oxalobacter formigenes]ARQ78673.1 CRISPR-associated protein Csy3 [Oxalobacter formigenes OXCC13]MCZ4061806.1 type I-F CRISPR-associated protein Csy3 [Oxalobacter formigenes]QDX32748.1 type I-F CRISPR-associated protein Csy3 [Oxalobacter formigenes]WAW01082.1 type I-F CRISPR-associated protein Csy3 [Oxalobacter formigenes]